MSLLQVKVKKGKKQSYKEVRNMSAVDLKGNTVRLCKPYAVRLPVRMSSIQSSMDHVAEVFLYGSDMEKVAYQAAALWNHWIRIKRGLKEEDYPKLQTYDTGMAESIAECIELDDGDYEEIWKAAKKCKHYKAGHPSYPVAFMLPPSDISYYK